VSKEELYACGDEGRRIWDEVIMPFVQSIPDDKPPLAIRET